MISRRLIFLIGFGFLVFGCSQFEDSDAPAAFINVTDISVVAEDGQGIASDNITDLWVALDGQTLGVFPRLSAIPVIVNQAESQLEIFAGIRNNGIRDNPIIYPFYDRVELMREIAPGDQIDLDLEFRYRDDVNLRVDTDVDVSNDFGYDEDGDGSLNFEVVPDPVNPGNDVLSLELTDRSQIVELGTSSFYELPTVGGPIFLEMDYRGNMELLVGLVGFSQNLISKEYLIVLRPREDWNKIYIDLSTKVASDQLDAYRILIGTQLTNEDLTVGQIAVDNIKLLHF